jgi:hypothetical protein
VLATLWWPNTNPIGPALLWPVGIVVYVILMERLTKWRAIVLAAPLIFAILAVLSEGFPFGGRRFPNADDFVGYYLWNIAACCFALELARTGSKGALTYGAAVMFPMGWLVVLEVVARSFEFIEATRQLSAQRIMLVATAVWCVLFPMLTYRATQPYLQASRIRHHGN